MSQAADLAAPFDPACLRTNREKNNLTYVPISEVVARLNRVLGAASWSYEVLSTSTAGERQTRSGVYPLWVIAHVRLTATVDDITATKDGFGGQQVKFLRPPKVNNQDGPPENSAGPVDIGDEYKGAASDGLKKAAQHFGVALDLARSEDALAADSDPWWQVAGWDSETDAKTDLDAFVADVKATDAGDHMREFRKEHGFDWPPSREELVVLRSELDSLQQPFAEAAS